MEENKNLQAETIGEEQLEDVAGGIWGTSDLCYFEVQRARGCEQLTFKELNGSRYVKCKSDCIGGLNRCQCYRTDRCIGKWHLITQRDSLYYPSPIGEYNHEAKPF